MNVMARSRVGAKRTTARLVFFVCTLAILFSLFIVDLMTGPAGLSVGDVLSNLFGPGDPSSQAFVIVRQMRLPVACMAVVAGFSLGLAGSAMQTILHNPLASPYTLGVSSAASFGAALAIVNGWSFWMVPVSAFVFAMVCSLGVYLVARVKKGATHTLILLGVILGFLFSSLLSLMQFMAKENELQAIVFWMFGSLDGAKVDQVFVLLALSLVALLYLLGHSWKLTAIKTGETTAQSLGIAVGSLRLRVMILTSLLTAFSVCFVGTIGFVGLVAPHIVGFFTGEDQRFHLPASALMGALLLSFASIASKVIIPGLVFPVGITTTIIGIPFLFFLVLREKSL